jgi:hypothetical protein
MEFGGENFEASPDITQTGYTREQNAGKIWFDSSNINDVPFIAEGFQIIPSTGPSALFPNYTGAYYLPEGERESVYLSDDPEEGRSCPDSTSVTSIDCSEWAMAVEMLEGMAGSLLWNWVTRLSLSDYKIWSLCDKVLIWAERGLPRIYPGYTDLDRRL